MDRYGRLEQSQGLAKQLRVQGWCTRGMYLDRPRVVNMGVIEGRIKIPLR